MSSRHDRQERFVPIGASGQARIRAARVAVVGCGALGSAAAEMLARGGVGHLRLIDRDVVEPTNLQRQSLYAESDVGQAKAVAAAAAITRIDAAVTCDVRVADLQPSSALTLLADVDLVIDGADNFPVRHLVNEVCCLRGTPWVHGACIGAYGVSFPVLPGDTACLACVQGPPPVAGGGDTCDSAGIIAPAVHLVAAWQVTEALKILVGDRTAVRRDLVASDLWTGRHHRIALTRDPDCPACGANATRPHLAAGDDPAVVLCGRDAVQIRVGPVDLAALAIRLAGRTSAANAWLVRWEAEGRTLTCFRDGRVLVQGVADAAAARTAVDRWLG
jgi:molybdopterin-synthase adenylyltransferase